MAETHHDRFPEDTLHPTHKIEDEADLLPTGPNGKTKTNANHLQTSLDPTPEHP